MVGFRHFPEKKSKIQLWVFEIQMHYACAVKNSPKIIWDFSRLIFTKNSRYKVWIQPIFRSCVAIASSWRQKAFKNNVRITRCSTGVSKELSKLWLCYFGTYLTDKFPLAMCCKCAVPSFFTRLDSESLRAPVLNKVSFESYRRISTVRLVPLDWGSVLTWSVVDIIGIFAPWSRIIVFKPLW